MRTKTDAQTDVILGINNNLGQIRLTADARYAGFKKSIENLTAALEQGR